MTFPAVEQEAARLNVMLECHQMPYYIDSLLLSRTGGAVSVVSDKLPQEEQALAHALNLGRYSAVLHGATDANWHAAKLAARLLDLPIARVEQYLEKKCKYKRQ